jgi:tripartite-type tricarboxylate transporter receptor subunit TctC
MRAFMIAALALGLGAGGVLAQASYPEQPIKIIVGFPPGVAPDVTSRLLGDKFTETWGKPVVVENVTGASGNIAVERVAKAAPDGHTLLMGGNASLVVNPNLIAKLPYDPVKDFVYITQIFIVPNILVVRPDVPATTIQELIALAKARPDYLIAGHAGIGTSQHRCRIAARPGCCRTCSPATSTCSSATSPTSCRWSVTASCGRSASRRVSARRGFRSCPRWRSSVSPASRRPPGSG